MKKEFLAIGLILGISNIAVAQWPSQGGLGGGGRMMQRPTPDVQREVPPFLKGAQPLSQTWDPNIAALGNNPDGMVVTCFAEDSDNLYVGGDFQAFDTVSAQFIVHYNRKTNVWSALDLGVDNDVKAMVVHNGKLYVAGYFNRAGSANTVVNYIAMWDGAAWNNLGGGMNNAVLALAFVGDTLYAGGSFTQAGGNPASYLAYWDGHIWQEAFGGTSYPVEALVATHDTLFVGGNFNYVGSETSNTGILARGTAMLQDGNWSPLGTGYYCNCVAFFQGKLWVGGNYYLNDGTLANEIASWDGSTWTTYSSDTLVGTNATGDVDALAVVGDSLLALGNFSSMAGVPVNGIAVYHDSTWYSLQGGIYGVGYAAIPFDGKLYVGGWFTQAGGVNAMAIATLSKGIWSGIARMVMPQVGWAFNSVFAVATTGRYVFIGGDFTTIAGQTCNHVAAYDKRLKQWITLGPGVDGEVRSLAIKGDTLVVGGTFNHAGTITARHIAMCNITTKQWFGMGSGAYRYVGAIAVHHDTIYAPIAYILEGRVGFDYLGQWNGTSWNSYGNGLDAGYIDALAWEDSVLYAAGAFVETDNGTRVNYIAQLQDGYWGTLNGGLNSYAYALAVSGDSLYVGGRFTSADGLLDSSLATWNGTEWNPIAAPGLNGEVTALAADGHGGVYAGGFFSEVAGVTRNNLVHWNGSSYGTVGGGVFGRVTGLATDTSALYACGYFMYVGNSQALSLHFAALDGAGAGVTATPSNNATWSVYPNPSSASSTISLDLSKAEDVRIELFNSLGSRIAIIANGFYDIGFKDFSLDAHALPSGIYFLRLTSGGMVTTRSFSVERE